MDILHFLMDSDSSSSSENGQSSHPHEITESNSKDQGMKHSTENNANASDKHSTESNATDQVMKHSTESATDQIMKQAIESNAADQLMKQATESNAADQVMKQATEGNVTEQAIKQPTESNDIDQAMKQPAERNANDQVMEDSQSQSNEINENKGNKEEEGKMKNLVTFLPLYRAALMGDWRTARGFLKKNPDAETAKITWDSKTVLHVAVSTLHAILLVEDLLYYLTPAKLEEQTDDNGNTALSLAAMVGNTKAAKLLVKKSPELPQKPNNMLDTPLHLAAKYGHKETVSYLLSVTRDKEPSPYTGESGARLLKFLIIADFYGIALDLLKLYPKLALDQDKDKESCFTALAQKPLAFASGSQLGCGERKIYNCIPVEVDNVPLKPMVRRDVENPTETKQKCSEKSTIHRFLQQISAAFGTLCRKVHALLWVIIRKLVPSINHIYDAKLMHTQTLELLKHVCTEVSCRGENALELLRTPFFTATRLGIHEFVTEIIKAYPYVIEAHDEDNHYIFQLAILHRHEKIFSLLHQIGPQKNFIADLVDSTGNNLLHLAAKSAPSTRVSGAALQMQRELQWFKEVEKFVQPSFKEMKNTDKKTPKMVFTEEHEKFVKQGEEWMKATASSCTVNAVAALIASVVIAAALAFIVRGSKDSDFRIPNFVHEISYMVFAISVSISLCSSSTSLLMFLGIHSSSYLEKDFFKSLPTKLIIGLITLFISIDSMVIGYCATLYMVLFHRLNWVMVPIGLLACLPVTFAALLRFPLLVEIVRSTYGPSIFHQQNKDIIG